MMAALWRTPARCLVRSAPSAAPAAAAPYLAACRTPSAGACQGGGGCGQASASRQGRAGGGGGRRQLVAATAQKRGARGSAAAVKPRRPASPPPGHTAAASSTATHQEQPPRRPQSRRRRERRQARRPAHRRPRRAGPTGPPACRPSCAHRESSAVGRAGAGGREWAGCSQHPPTPTAAGAAAHAAPCRNYILACCSTAMARALAAGPHLQRALLLGGRLHCVAHRPRCGQPHGPPGLQ